MAIIGTKPGIWPTKIGPARFASRLHDEINIDTKVALLGAPDDTGVRMNGGRPGAILGPTAFRGALARYGAAEPGGFVWPGVFDAGDVLPGDSLGETHDRVTAATRELLDKDVIPVMIGGGHDLTYPFVRALAEEAEQPMVGVYFDAHLDVRDQDGSGMPFRRLIEHCGVRELHVHGLDTMANSAEHLAWFQSHGGHVDPFGPDDDWPAGELFVSFDLDVIDQACAPGVSATNPCGWGSSLACRWARAAGRQPRVRCFDIMELCPPNDTPPGDRGRTARLAARLFLEFVRGVSERPA